MELLDNPVRPYAWGSRTVIAELLGRPSPSPHPQAELWLGAHPADPSHVVRDDVAAESLIELIDADPDRTLGADRAGRWGGRLPFLLKVLAADEPLSLQAHPSAEQAAAGFERENALGMAPDAPERNYRDPNHKPELICALTEFDALVGFREAEASVRFLRALDVPALGAYVELLAAQPGPDGLRDLRAIAAQAGRYLAPGGWLLLEHGWDQAAAVQQLLRGAGLVQVQVRNDLAGIGRCTGGQRPRMK